METVQQNGRFTLFSSKFLSIYSILYGWNGLEELRKPPYILLYIYLQCLQLRDPLISKYLNIFQPLTLKRLLYQQS